MGYKPDPKRDALAFDVLQNLTPEQAQAFFWNFKSRDERREAILAFKAYHDMRQQPRIAAIAECAGVDDGYEEESDEPDAARLRSLLEDGT